MVDDVRDATVHTRESFDPTGFTRESFDPTVRHASRSIQRYTHTSCSSGYTNSERENGRKLRHALRRFERQPKQWTEEMRLGLGLRPGFDRALNEIKRSFGRAFTRI
eukprot:1048604-Prorocentrum_minimum.AAC.1